MIKTRSGWDKHKWRIQTNEMIAPGLGRTGVELGIRNSAAQAKIQPSCSERVLWRGREREPPLTFNLTQETTHLAEKKRRRPI